LLCTHGRASTTTNGGIDLSSFDVLPHYLSFYPKSHQYFFTGSFPPTSHAFADILTHGRQLETFDISCYALECSNASLQFRSVQGTNSFSSPFRFLAAVHPCEGFKGLKIGYSSDLSPGLASWLIPRTVLALSLIIDYSTPTAGDLIPFLELLRHV